jgi:succinate semialdehyde reductase (NADPH)
MPAQTMTAAVLNSAPGGLQIEQLPIPEPLANEVLIKVHACGVCHTDLHVMKAEVAFPTPAVMGHEVSGTVVALGSVPPAAPAAMTSATASSA